MTRLLLIPVGGTLLALLAIACFRQPRESAEPAEPETPPFHLPSPDEVEEGPEEHGEDHPPTAPPRTFRLEVAADGSIEDVEGGHTFPDTDSVIEALATDGGVRHAVRLAKASPEISDETFENAAAKLEERFDVTKVHRGPKEGG